MSTEIHQKLCQQLASFPILVSALKRNRVLSLNPGPRDQLFTYLARSVAGQQLSNIAARTIWQRVESLQPEGSCLSDLFVEQHQEQLRQCGLSRAKIRTIIGVRQALELPGFEQALFTFASSEELIRELTALWGIGPWTAQMTAIFFFAFADVWSPGDAALKRGLNWFAGQEGVDSEEILSAATPYRSYLALHLWHCLDTDFFTAMES